MKRSTSLLFSGALWLIMGSFLLYKGLGYFVYSRGIIIDTAQLASHESRVSTMISFALLIGFIKGRFILRKSVDRIVRRVLSLSEPIRFTKLYNLPYLLLILSMILLGQVMRLMNLDSIYRGFIDVTIGSALIFGSLLFFRASHAIKGYSKE